MKYYIENWYNDSIIKTFNNDRDREQWIKENCWVEYHNGKEVWFTKITTEENIRISIADY